MRAVRRSMERIIKKLGFSGIDGESFVTYLLFGRIWFHVNRRFRWPLFRIVELPF